MLRTIVRALRAYEENREERGAALDAPPTVSGFQREVSAALDRKSWMVSPEVPIAGLYRTDFLVKEKDSWM